MTNHYAYQLHKLYKNLVSDIIHTLGKGEWALEAEVLNGLPSIPSGIANLSVHFCVTRDGTVIVDVKDEDAELAYWRLDRDVTGIEVDRSAIMSVGRLQNTFERFWDGFISKCTRHDMHHRRGVVRAITITNRVYFADRVLKSWLTHNCVDVTIRPGEIRIGNDVYHTNRSWRRNVRDRLGMGVQHENAD